MSLLKEMLPYVRPYRTRILVSLGGMAVFTSLSVIPPLLNKYLVDTVIGKGAWSLLFVVVSAIVVAPIMAAALRFANIQILMRASRRFLGDVRLAMYEKMLSLGVRYHSENPSGMLVGRLMTDVARVQQLLTADTVQMVIDVVVFVFSVSVAFFISWKLALILCVVIVCYVVAYRYFSARIQSATQASRAMYDQTAARLQETIAGVRAVRIYNRGPWETATFLEKTARSLDKALTSTMGSISLSTVCSGIAGFGSTIIAGIGAWLILRGEMTYGDLHALNNYVWMALTPAVRLTTIAGQLNETFVSVRRILEVLVQVPDVRSAAGAPRIFAAKGEVSLRAVHFAYDPGKPLYRGLTLDIPAAKSTALVGPTGCGKTTLTSLLMRFWDIDGGEILIDGTDIRTVDLKSLRRLFGVVLQDPVIFEGTVADNIAYGAPGATREAIEEAARAAEILDTVAAMPGGMDTVLGSEGVKLSLGEKQRISIARAILRKPLILVMDEATASLDSNSEALIQKAMARVLRDRTSIVVAHRLSTVVKADQIVVMENGAIVARGTHGELMRDRGGLYRRLYREMLGQHRRAAQ